MVEAATANAGPEGTAGVLPVQRGSRRSGAVMRPTEAAQLIGVGINTIRRRVDAWLAGNRTDYALKGGRAGTDRYVDPDDARALAAQLRGELGPNRHVPPDDAL